MLRTVLVAVLAVCFMSPVYQAIGQQYVANVAVSDGKICASFLGGVVATVGARLYFGTLRVHFVDDQDIVKRISGSGIELLKVGSCEVLLKSDSDQLGAPFRIDSIDVE